eukprot:g11623.t1
MSKAPPPSYFNEAPESGEEATTRTKAPPPYFEDSQESYEAPTNAKAAPPSFTIQLRATHPPGSDGSSEEESHSKYYKMYWGILSESLLTWMIAVAVARETKWFQAKVYSSLLFWSSKKYDIGLGKCSAYGDVDSDDVDDACGLSKAARGFQILATLVLSAVPVLVLYASISSPPDTGKYGLYAGISLAVFSVLELITVGLAASYAGKVGAAYDDDSRDYFSLGVSFYLAVVALVLGTAGSIASLVLRKSATKDEDGPLAKFAVAQFFANFRGVVRDVQELNNPTRETQGTQGIQGTNGTQGTQGTQAAQGTV